VDTEIVGRIEQVTGHTQDIVYDLVFTHNKIVALIVEHPADMPYRPHIMDFFIGNRSGRRREWIERKKLSDERRTTYRQGSLDKLITAHSRNFEVNFDNIISIEIKNGVFNSRLNIVVKRVDSRKLTLRFGLVKSAVPAMKELLNKVLPAKLK
jgi:hypothetical protein